MGHPVLLRLKSIQSRQALNELEGLVEKDCGGDASCFCVEPHRPGECHFPRSGQVCLWCRHFQISLAPKRTPSWRVLSPFPFIGLVS